MIVLAGDFNTLPEDDVVARTAMCSIIDKPTRGTNKLDRIYVSEPDYTSIKVVTSTGKSDHKAVIAYTGSPLKTANKSKTQLLFRRRSPNQHALFLSYLSSLDISFDTRNDVQTNFDELYQIMLCLLDHLYRQRRITITSTAPDFTTPTVGVVALALVLRVVALLKSLPLKTANTSRTQPMFRRRSPNQHALFLSPFSSLDISFDTCDDA